MLDIPIPDEHAAAFLLDDRKPAGRRPRQPVTTTTTHIPQPAAITSRSLPIELPKQPRFRLGTETATTRRPETRRFANRTERPQDHQPPQPRARPRRSAWRSSERRRSATAAAVRPAGRRRCSRGRRSPSSYEQRLLQVHVRRGPRGRRKGRRQRPRTILPRGRSRRRSRREQHEQEGGGDEEEEGEEGGRGQG